MFLKTQAAYRGHGHSSYIDTWAFPIEHLSMVTEYRSMPRISAQFKGVTAKTLDRIPLMVFMFHTLVESNKDRFIGDTDAQVKAINDLTCETNVEVVYKQSSKTCNHKE